MPKLSTLKYEDLRLGMNLIWIYGNEFDDDSIWEVVKLKKDDVHLKVISHRSYTKGDIKRVHWPLQFMEVFEGDPDNLKYLHICRKIKQMDRRWTIQQLEKGNKPCGVSVATVS